MLKRIRHTYKKKEIYSREMSKMNFFFPPFICVELKIDMNFINVKKKEKTEIAAIKNKGESSMKMR